MRPRGRPTIRHMDTIRRDIKKNGLPQVNVLDRNDWRMTVSRVNHRCGRGIKVKRRTKIRRLLHKVSCPVVIEEYAVYVNVRSTTLSTELPQIYVIVNGYSFEQS